MFAQQQAAPDPHKAVLDRLESLTVIPLADWKTHVADMPHGEDAALNEATWEPISTNGAWTTGAQWVRRTFEVPERLNGWDVKGATLALDVYVGSGEAIQISTFSNGSLIGRTDEDTQLPITMTSNARPGEKFVIAVRVVGNPVKTTLNRARILVSAGEGRPDVGRMRMQFASLKPIIAAYETGKAEREQQLDAAIKAVDLNALDKGDQVAFDASLRAAQTKLEALRPFVNQFSIKAAGNSHIDMAWLWPETETVEVTRNTFGSALQMMREYPKLTFSMASAQTYYWMEQKYPAMFRDIQQRVKEGRWEIVGGMWVEPDLNLPDGEALVRQVVLGKRYFKDKFGVDVKIGWNPDSFGYNWQLPQIYKRAGMDYFVTQKIYWNDTTKFPHKVFWWQAPDGSKLLTYFPHDYANPLEPVRMAKDVAMYAPAMWKDDAGAGKAKPGSLEMLYLFGVGDHGGGPTRADLDTAVGLQNDPAVVYPKVEFGTAQSYFTNLEKRAGELNLPTWNDELYLEYHRGVQTTQAKTKEGNRKAEVAMLNAEKLASIGSLLGQPYPREAFDGAWKKVLFNQFHDILPGSGIAVNYADATEKYEQVQRVARDSKHESLEKIGANVGTPMTSILVFNPLSWKRSGIVEAEVQLPWLVPPQAGKRDFDVSGVDGRNVLTKVLSLDEHTKTVRLAMRAEDMPPLGYSLLFIRPVITLGPRVNPERKLPKLEVDPKTGCITSLIDSESGKELLAPAVKSEGSPANLSDGKACANLLQIFTDKPKRWDAWNVDADFTKEHVDLLETDEVKVVEDSSLRKVIRVRKHYGNSTFIQDITLAAGSPRVDVHMTVDWHEKRKMLKVAVPVSVKNEKATFEIPYGTIERPTTRRTPEEQAKFEVPALRWADLSDATHGLSLLNDSKYGYDVKDNVIRLSLLRSPEWPDPHADEGHHEFTYSLYPHAGDWRAAMTMRQGYELNEPLMAISLQPHEGLLPTEKSFFGVDADNVIITAVKQNEGDDAMTLRMFEWAGKKANVSLTLPAGLKAVGTTDLMEKTETMLKEGDKIAVGPYEVKTVRLEKTGNRE
jgi:alpha-mannosidase